MKKQTVNNACGPPQCDFDYWGTSPIPLLSAYQRYAAAHFCEILTIKPRETARWQYELYKKCKSARTVGC